MESGNYNKKGITLKCRNKKIFVYNLHKLGFIGRFTGLMLRSRKTRNLLFDFGSDVSIPIHSLFVFFPFLAIWIDSDNNVLEWQIIRPFRLSALPKKKFRKLVEVPLNSSNMKITEFFVGKERFKYKRRQLYL